MSLKALAEAALQQCAPRTLPARSSNEAPAHSSSKSEDVRTLQDAWGKSSSCRQCGYALSEEKTQDRCSMCGADFPHLTTDRATELTQLAQIAIEQFTGISY
jgi:rubrerythrin